MEKRFIGLQLFAESAVDGADHAADNQQTETVKEDDKQKQTEMQLDKPEKAKPQPKYTDEDVDRLFNQKFAEWQKKKDKEINEAKRLAEMNAQERAEYERDQLQKELDAYKQKDSIAEMTKVARKMLSDNDITISDDLLAVMVTTDADQTKAAVEGFMHAFSEAVESAVKDRLKGAPPKKGTSGGALSMTKEAIMAIKDPELRQKKMLENKELFNF